MNIIDTQFLSSLKVGDEVTRMLAGTTAMPLKVTSISENKIVCGLWEFDRNTGLEIDDDFHFTVSYLLPALKREKDNAQD